MMPRQEGVWPAVYDEESLTKEIARICTDYEDGYYLSANEIVPGPFQGDIFHIETLNEIYYHDKDGNLTAFSHDSCLWILAGNTCDVDHANYTLLAPIISLGKFDAISSEITRACKSQQSFRQFYLPSWDESTSRSIMAVDFTRIIHAEVDLVRSKATLLKRLSRPGWVLFNACIVRFLARGDGRETA